MSLYRIFATLFLAASLSGGVAAQGVISPDDETIFLAVEDALRGARSLAGAEIEVTSRDGVVTLSGSALSVEAIATASRLAFRVRGVVAVNNEIRVSDRPSRA
jgi:hyperosmotically inducible periplasmic protein